MADTIDQRKQQLESAKAQLDTDLRQTKATSSAAQKAYQTAQFKTMFGGNSAQNAEDLKRLKAEADYAKKAYGTVKGSVNAFNKDEAITLAQDTAALKQSENLRLDLGQANTLVDDVLGDDGNLARIRDDASVQDAQAAYKNATDLSQQRDRATQSLQGAEVTTNRQLAASLAASGVKGGVAGGAFTDLASANLRNRAGLEQDLAINNVAATKDRAAFETGLAQFDIGQQTAEQNLRLSTRTGIAQVLQAERSGVNQDLKNNKIAKVDSGGGGTVLCTAMYHHGFINADVFYCDIEAGRKFITSRQTRKAFLMYNKVCKPIANYAIRNRWFAQVIRPIIVPIAKHFSDNNKLGKFLFSTFSIPFKLMARFS